MYGVQFSRENGLRTLNDGGVVFEYYKVPLKYTWTRFGTNAPGMHQSVSTEYHIPRAILKNSVVAIEEGSIMSWNHKDSNISLLRIATLDMSKPAKAHLFKPYDGSANKDLYGVNIYNSQQKLIYNSSLKTAKVIGYISKFNPKPVWYRSIGQVTKLAFVQVGNDLSLRHVAGAFEYSKASVIECVGTHVSVRPNVFLAPPNWNEANNYWRSNYDILWFILDISDL
ncbi:hypothetical protein [Wohlfahrtiimonas chitiniclastica]|uniref:hypothetical protein n=1 Tax=Wohlfahrtiimonas chitiniclastica TaxID=400946 RepID=UPI000B9814E0|nr:hypothetical protein [Wohlfahrtiimonas chitiniclastica]MBS7835136.1 hypothetical protein [Wohlfahrtiimonas chitiniclastica]MBS7837198.1 hypothetical protein [Wohlfahrtiimonas chitiniclastica]OYQ76068.1 hypothetical protein B9T18_01555 [Wohlfahrtiimonas chitiniclastica]